MGHPERRYPVFWWFRQISRLGRPLGTRRSQRLASQPQRFLQRTPPLISGGRGDSCCGQHRAGERCCQRCGQYASRERAGAFADLHGCKPFPIEVAPIPLSRRFCSKEGWKRALSGHLRKGERTKARILRVPYRPDRPRAFSLFGMPSDSALSRVPIPFGALECPIADVLRLSLPPIFDRTYLRR